MSDRIRIRDGTAQDSPVVESMLFEAFHWSPAHRRPDLKQFRKNPEFQKLVSNWGERTGDTLVIAELEGRAVGAAWYRYWTRAIHSYGFVSEEYPEVGMGVLPTYRSRGIGRDLLRRLVTRARVSGVAGLSLSVDPKNFAQKLYRSEGFEVVGRSGTSETMLLDLT